MNIEVTFFEGGHWARAEVRHTNERSLIATLNSSRRRFMYTDLLHQRGPLISIYAKTRIDKVVRCRPQQYANYLVHSVRFPSGREWDVVNGIRWGGRTYDRGYDDQPKYSHNEIFEFAKKLGLPTKFKL